MNSNNEEYLDSLLNSAQKSNKNNPQSALSRMSSKHNTSGSQSGSGDISALVNNSNGNVVLTAQMFGNSPETIRKHYYVGEDIERKREVLNARSFV